MFLTGLDIIAFGDIDGQLSFLGSGGFTSPSELDQLNLRSVGLFSAGALRLFDAVDESAFLPKENTFSVKDENGPLVLDEEDMPFGGEPEPGLANLVFFIDGVTVLRPETKSSLEPNDDDPVPAKELRPNGFLEFIDDCCP